MVALVVVFVGSVLFRAYEEKKPTPPELANIQTADAAEQAPLLTDGRKFGEKF